MAEIQPHIPDLHTALKWLQAEYKVKVLESYEDKVNSAYKGKKVGYLVVKNGTVFLMRFRRNVMNFNSHYPGAPRGLGFGCNRSELERQMNGILIRRMGIVVDNVWTMVVRPDMKVYIASPWEIKAFVRQYNTTKGLFRKSIPDEDEDIFNVPFRLFFNFDKWLSGEQTQSDYEWRETFAEART